MKIRLAEVNDIDFLIDMRWNFTLEYRDNISEDEYNSFYDEYHQFLVNAIKNENWYIWVAEDNGIIISHIFLELIHKVPRPGRNTYPFVYMTNVYTLPEYRNKGIGSKLINKINDWVKEKKYEFIIVWPSDKSINFYKRNGFRQCTEPMENMFYEW